MAMLDLVGASRCGDFADNGLVFANRVGDHGSIDAATLHPASIFGKKYTSAPSPNRWKYAVSWICPSIATVVSSSR